MAHYSWIASLIPRRSVGGAGRAAARLGLDVAPADFLANAATVGVAVTPSTQIVPQGLTAFFPVRLTRHGVSGAVSVTAPSGLPAGAVADPLVIPAGEDTGTLVVRLPGTPAGGDYAFSVTATSGLGTVGTASATLTVAADAPAAIGLTLAQAGYTVSAGASVAVLVTLARTNYTNAVGLAVSGLPTGVTGSFSPTSLTGGTLTSTLTLTATGGAATADVSFTVTASGAGVTNAVATATLHVDATPSTRPQIAFKAMRHDGLTGNARAVGFIQFKPGEIAAADVANATAWDTNGAEVGIYIEDIGARHLSNNVANGLLGAHVQLDTTFAAPGSEPAYTLKFDQPVGPQSRITAQAYTEWTQTLTVSISGTDNTRLHVEAGTCHPYDQNAPIPFPAQDVTWGFTQAMTIPATGYGINTVRLAVRHATGAVIAYPHNVPSAASQTPFYPTLVNQNWYKDYNPGPTNAHNVVGESVIGFVTVYVAAGTAATTLGTSPLNGAGLTVTTTGVGQGPFSTLPTEMPVASLAPYQTDYLCATEFPGYKLTPESVQLTSAAPAPALLPLKRRASDWVWGRLGWYTYLTDGGTTWYNHALQSWIRYAESGESRFYRRALATQKAFRWFANGTGGGYINLPEANADIAQSLVYYALTQRPFDTLNTAAAVEVAAARQVLTRNEAADYNGHSATTPGLYSTGRWAMHVIQGCPWFARLGVDPGAGYTLGTKQTLAKDTNLWPNGPSWVSVSTAYAHFARMCSRIRTSMVTDAANSPGMRYIGQPQYFDHSPWMSHWLWSYMAVGLKTFGVPEETPGGVPSGIVQDMTDSLEYDFSGLSKYNANPFYVTTPVGDRAFTFGTPGAASNGGSTATYTNLSGISLLALAYMKQTTTGAARALWASRGAAVYSGMQRYKDGTTQFFYWNAKDLPEADLVGSAYLAEAA